MGAEPLRHRVDPRVVVVEDHLELRGIEPGEEGLQEIRDGVGAQVRGKKSDAQPAQRLRRVRRIEGGRVRHRGAKRRVLGVHGLAANPVKVVKGKEPAAARLVVAGIALEHRRVGLDGLHHLVSLLEHKRPACQGELMRGIKLQRAVQEPQRLILAARLGQRDPEVRQRVGPFGLKRDHAPENGYPGLKAGGRAEERAQLVEGVGEVGVQGDRALEGGARPRGMPEGALHDAQVAPGLR